MASLPPLDDAADPRAMEEFAADLAEKRDPIDTILAANPDLKKALESGSHDEQINAMRLIRARMRENDTSAIPIYSSHSEPEFPSACIPGTPEKVEQMARRVEEGRQAFHPLDRVGLPDAEKTPDPKRNGSHCKDSLRREAIQRKFDRAKRRNRERDTTQD